MKQRPGTLERFRAPLVAAVSARAGLTCDGIAGFAPDDAIDIALSRASRKAFHNDAYVDAWLRRARARTSQCSRRIPLFGLDHWRINPATGNIEHDTGRFFTLLGAKVRLRSGLDELEWDQPFIDQAEVGILGILVTRINGILHFCLQAKEEPGNLHGVQLSPTVQATFSNYTRSHGGQQPALVELFLRAHPDDILYARLQAEDGGRFLFKSNRNMIVRCAPGAIPSPSARFIWLTLRQIANLLRQDNVINACARSILAAMLHAGAMERDRLDAMLRSNRLGRQIDPATWPIACAPDKKRGTPTPVVRGLLDWLDAQKAMTHLHVKRVPLASLADWRVSKQGFFVHRDRRFFRIVGLSVTSKNREIGAWSQPIIENTEEGIIGLLVQDIDGCRCVLMQTKAEPGNRPPVQIAPTVQFTPANYLSNDSLPKPFLFDEFIRPTLGRVIHESRQSEEGARFFRECHVHRIIEVPAGTELDLPDNYRWMPLDAVRFFLHLGEHVNSCARSILACML